MARDKFRSIAPYPHISVQFWKCVWGLSVLKKQSGWGISSLFRQKFLATISGFWAQADVASLIVTRALKCLDKPLSSSQWSLMLQLSAFSYAINILQDNFFCLFFSTPFSSYNYFHMVSHRAVRTEPCWYLRISTWVFLLTVHVPSSR